MEKKSERPTGQSVLRTLAHLANYSVTLPELLQRQVFPDKSLDAVQRFLERLVHVGWINCLAVQGKRKCFVLSTRALRKLGLGKRPTTSVSQEALVQHLGVLYFCVQHGVEKFTAQEFIQEFPEYARRGLPAEYYFIDASEARKRLSWIEIDHGANAEHLVRRIRKKVIGKRYNLEAFAKLIQARLFQVIVVTATANKALAIEEAVRKRSPSYVRIVVHVVPELLPLLLSKGK